MDAAWVALALVGIAAFLCAFSYLGARMSGWSVLAQYYSTNREFDGKLWRFRHARIGWLTYGGVLTLGSGVDGFYLKVAPPYRLGHPALLIPWEELTLSVVQGWVFEYFVFHSTKVPETGIRVRKWLGQEIIKASAGRGLS